MIAERLKKVRLLLGYGDNQKEFAEKLDMKQGSYSDVERGKTKSISKRMIRNLYIKFGVNEDYLLNGSLPIFLDKKNEEIFQANNDIVEHLHHLLTLLEAKEKQVNELISQQAELIQQQKKLIDTITSLTKYSK